jgi:hypothetical protein
MDDEPQDPDDHLARRVWLLVLIVKALREFAPPPASLELVIERLRRTGHQGAEVWALACTMAGDRTLA